MATGQEGFEQVKVGLLPVQNSLFWQSGCLATGRCCVERVVALEAFADTRGHACALSGLMPSGFRPCVHGSWVLYSEVRDMLRDGPFISFWGIHTC